MRELSIESHLSSVVLAIVLLLYCRELGNQLLGPVYLLGVSSAPFAKRAWARSRACKRILGRVCHLGTEIGVPSSNLFLQPHNVFLRRQFSPDVPVQNIHKKRPCSMEIVTIYFYGLADFGHYYMREFYVKYLLNAISITIRGWFLLP